MVKIIEKIRKQQQQSDSPCFFSFEFFPPKTQEGVENLYLRMDRMTSLQPIFVDITWGAGGSTKDLTFAISKYSQTYFGVEVLMHLTCTNMKVEELKLILTAAKEAGIQNILVLRGDPAKGAVAWESIPGGLANAIDLVKLIKKEHGDYFGIAVAGFPEGHPSSFVGSSSSNSNNSASGVNNSNKTNVTVGGSIGNSENGNGIKTNGNSSTLSTESNNSIDSNSNNNTIVNTDAIDKELYYLKQKVDAGADFILTNFFYDTQVFIDYVERCRKVGISCPIIPGMMPIQSFSTFKRMTSFCRIHVPSYIMNDLNPISEDDEAVKAYGVKLCTNMCKILREQAFTPGFHFYTLNLEKSVLQVLHELGIEESSASRRSLPWRGSRPNLNKMGTAEDVRPINWANRPKSYIKRTTNWDEFPNGRWGDNRSPAFGELSQTHFYRSVDGTKEDRLAMWGEAPITPQDIYEVFALYVEGKIPITPWCEANLQSETTVIVNPLADMNRHGFLTINSQPAVNGARSDDSLYGWGGPNGRVYQKAYVEFFVDPELLPLVLNVLNKYSNLSVYAVDAAGITLHDKNGSNGNSHMNSHTASPSPSLDEVNLNSNQKSKILSGNNSSNNNNGLMKKRSSGGGGVTAVTWGVFPDKEVLQPTVFDPETFLVWSKEAFELWTQAWAAIYDDDSESCSLLYQIHDTYYLVAVIDNDYIDSNLFAAFAEIIQAKKDSINNASTSNQSSNDDDNEEEDD